MKKGIAKCTAFVLAAGLTIGQGGSVFYAAGTDFSLVGLHSRTHTAQSAETIVAAGAEKTADMTEAAAAYEAEGTAVTEVATDVAGFSAANTAVEVKTAENTETEEAAAQAEEAVQTEAAENTVNAEAVDAVEAADAAEVAAPAEAAENTDAAAEEQVPETETETEAIVLDTSMVGSTGFAQCEEYLNVRTEPGTEGEVAGKVYNNGSVEILGVAPNGWYQVRSGNLEGYVSPDYVAIGDAAEEIAASTGYTTAEVGTEVLNVRSSATTDSDVIATIDNTNVIEVVEDQGDWVKVILDGEMYGYVSADYVNTTTEYATGETLEEEQERLDREWLAYLAEQEAARQAAEAAYLAAIAQQQAQATYTYVDTGSTSSYADTSYTVETQTVDSSAAAEQASYAYQSYLDAQEAADAAVADGADEQTIIDTAAQAQAAYADYLGYQEQADAAAAGVTEIQYTDEVQAVDQTGAAYTVEAQAIDNTAAYDEQASTAYQNYLDAQAAADAAVADGADEQTILDTAADAQAAYADYLGYQDQADAAAAGMTVTQTADNTAAAAETTGYETTAATTATYTEDTSSYAEDTSSQTSYSSGSSVGEAIANYATQFVGNPYVYGGSSLTGGADCSGFTMSVLANFGVSLPHNAAAQSGYGTAVSMDNLQPGDLLFYEGGGGIGHVSIYIGNGQVVHASNPTNGILISSVDYRTPCAARRMA